MIQRLKTLIPDRSPLRLLWHRGRGFLAALRYGFPARRLRIIGVTGTDGKTTTVAMIAHILRCAGKSVGAVSSTFFRINDHEWENPTHKTSLDPFAFQRFLKQCTDAHCEFVIVEASSHGLVQGRLGPLQPEVAAITNTSIEHLDYHGTMEQYRTDKGMLLRMLRGRGTKVLNANDATFEAYSNIPSEHTIIYYARENFSTLKAQSSKLKAVLWLSDIRTTLQSCSATLHSESYQLPATSRKLALPIPGAFNIENALCAISCAMAVGVPLVQAVQSLAACTGVPGRLERIDEGQPFLVFVDFTVSPQAYEKILSTVRSMIDPGKRVLVLTGSCGDRMREKRPMIGEICARLADVVVVSTDETYTEDPLAVIDEVFAGIDQQKTHVRKIPDRRAAIAFLFREAAPGDAVVLCGMGACTTMMTREGTIPWDEREIARKLLRKS